MARVGWSSKRSCHVTRGETPALRQTSYELRRSLVAGCGAVASRASRRAQKVPALNDPTAVLKIAADAFPLCGAGKVPYRRKHATTTSNKKYLMSRKRGAIVLGASGSVGNALVKEVFSDGSFDPVITIGYPSGEDGFRSSVQGDELNAMEDALLQVLGKDAVYIGRETGLGRRIIHLHAAASGPAHLVLERWERSYSTSEIATEVHRDPQWKILRKW